MNVTILVLTQQNAQLLKRNAELDEVVYQRALHAQQLKEREVAARRAAFNKASDDFIRDYIDSKPDSRFYNS